MKRILTVAVIVGVIGLVGWQVSSLHAKVNSRNGNPSSNNKSEANSFNKTQFSLADPTSIWVIVNKQRSLRPPSYTPPDLVVPNVPLRVPGNDSMRLRKVTSLALERMFKAAKAQDISLMLASGYRSYSYQVGLYGGYVKSMGQAAADKQSARPGYSEHQTGLAADVEPLSRACELDACFANTAEGKWITANAYKYGFIIRYPKDKVSVTGYEFEPWHIRYVGVPLATELHIKHVETLEEFFGVTGGPNY